MNIHLKEKKDKFINELVSRNIIEPAQGAELKRFFLDHPNYESKLDWNKYLTFTWETFEELMNSAKKSNSAVKQGRISSLEIGKDYVILGEATYGKDPVIIYQPFTWEASRILASDKVGPKVTGKWCVSYQKSSSDWKRYTLDEKKVFAFVEGERIPTKKVAFEIEPIKETLTIWSCGDTPYEAKFYDSEKRVEFEGRDAKMVEALGRAFTYKFLNIVIKRASSNQDKVIKASEEEDKRITNKNIEKLKNLLYMDLDTEEYCGELDWETLTKLPAGSYEEVPISTLKITGIKSGEYFDYKELAQRKINPDTLICKGTLLVTDALEEDDKLPKTFKGKIAYKRCDRRDLTNCPKGVTDVELYNCPRLETLEGIPANVNELSITWCPELESFGTLKHADDFDSDSSVISELYDRKFCQNNNNYEDIFNDDDFYSEDDPDEDEINNILKDFGY